MNLRYSASWLVLSGGLLGAWPIAGSDIMIDNGEVLGMRMKEYRIAEQMADAYKDVLDPEVVEQRVADLSAATRSPDASKAISKLRSSLPSVAWEQVLSSAITQADPTVLRVLVQYLERLDDIEALVEVRTALRNRRKDAFQGVRRTASSRCLELTRRRRTIIKPDNGLERKLAAMAA